MSVVYDWDKLFADWKAIKGDDRQYAWDEVILCKGKEKIKYSSYSYLKTTEKFRWLEELPFEVRQSLADYMKKRVATVTEKAALDKLSELGVIK